MLTLFLAAALTVLDWWRTLPNVGAVWNGYGALCAVLGRRGYAPMRYRVLMAWLFRFGTVLRPEWMLTPIQYQLLKGGLIWAGLAVAQQLVGVGALPFLVVLLALLLEFDYWSSYAELLGVGLVLLGSGSGQVGLVVLGAVVWGLSKETAAAAPALGLLAGGLLGAIGGLAGPLALAIVRRVQGRGALYCARWTLREYNVPDLGVAVERRDVGPLLSLVWSVATVAAMVVVARSGAGPLQATAPAAGTWILAGWLMARARETRVFMPTVFWIVAAAVEAGLLQ